MAVGMAMKADQVGQYNYSKKITLFVVLSCMVASMGGILFGYDIGISGSCLISLQALNFKDWNTFLKSIPIYLRKYCNLIYGNSVRILYDPGKPSPNTVRFRENWSLNKLNK